MTSRDFCYWLQGYFEISGGPDALTKQQVEMIQRHLSLVFVHEIDPSMGDKEHQDRLNKIHNGKADSIEEAFERIKNREGNEEDYNHMFDPSNDGTVRC